MALAPRPETNLSASYTRNPPKGLFCGRCAKEEKACPGDILTSGGWQSVHSNRILLRRGFPISFFSAGTVDPAPVPTSIYKPAAKGKLRRPVLAEPLSAVSFV